MSKSGETVMVSRGYFQWFETPLLLQVIRYLAKEMVCRSII